MRPGRGIIFIKAVAAILFLLAISACGAASSPTPVPPAPAAVLTAGTASAQIPPATPGPDSAPPVSLAEATAPLALAFEGNGDELLGPFVVSQGVLIMIADYQDEGNFVVSITGDEGEQEPSINSSGPYFGNLLYSVYRENVNGLAPGAHSLKVTAVGSWRIRLFQDFPRAGQKPTIELGGVGDGGGGWVELSEGSYTVRANHDGQRHFKVMLFDSIGTPEVVVIDEAGPFDATIPITVSPDPSIQGPAPGVYAIGVLADGIWSIILSNAEAPSR